MTDKTSIRQSIRNLKKAVSTEERLFLSRQLTARLESHPRFANARTILLYHSLPDEVDTHELIRCWSGKKKILLPVVNGDDLDLKEYKGENTLENGHYGISEPTGHTFTAFNEIDLAVIPGMAFDRNGNRLGRGKGYYDRLLSRLGNSNIYKLGLCFDFQFLPHIPAEPHDILMDEVLH